VRYKQRNVVERCVNKLKAFRAIASRYDKREYMYAGTVDIASIRNLAPRPSHMIQQTRPRSAVWLAQPAGVVVRLAG